MTYEEFKVTLAEAVTKLAGEEVSVTIHEVQKNNGVLLDAISVMPEDSMIAPSIYLCDFYEYYIDGCPMEELAERIIEISEQSRDLIKIPEDFFSSYEKARLRICYRLINYEKNQELLQQVPHRRWRDLAIVFYYSAEPDIFGNSSILIRNSEMEHWGVTIEELETDAKENTPKLHVWDWITMENLLEKSFRSDTFTIKVKVDERVQIPMYILTNKEKFYGASVILYPGLLEEIATRLNGPFYVLPSSIHECIIMPVMESHTKESLSKMVADINANHVDDIDILADHAYYYDCETKELS